MEIETIDIMEIETIKTNGTTLFLGNHDKKGRINLLDEELLTIHKCFDDDLLPHGRFFCHSCIYQAVWFCLAYVYELPVTLFDIFTSVMYFTNTSGFGIQNLYLDTDNTENMTNITNFARAGNFLIIIYVVNSNKLIIGRKIGNKNAKYIVHVLSKDDHFELIASMYDQFNKYTLERDGYELRKLTIKTIQPDTSLDEKIAQELYETEVNELEKTMTLIRKLLIE